MPVVRARHRTPSSAGDGANEEPGRGAPKSSAEAGLLARSIRVTSDTAGYAVQGSPSKGWVRVEEPLDRFDTPPLSPEILGIKNCAVASADRANGEIGDHPSAHGITASPKEAAAHSTPRSTSPGTNLRARPSSTTAATFDSQKWRNTRRNTRRRTPWPLTRSKPWPTN